MKNVLNDLFGIIITDIYIVRFVSTILFRYNEITLKCQPTLNFSFSEWVQNSSIHSVYNQGNETNIGNSHVIIFLYSNLLSSWWFILGF